MRFRDRLRNYGNPVRSVQNTYGGEGELLATSGGEDSVAYSYNADYHRTTLKDGNNHTTSYAYDTAGNMTQLTYPGGQTIKYTQIDPAGRVLTKVDGNNVTTTFTYDPLDGQLSTVTYPEKTVTYSYDTDGRLTTLMDNTSTITYSYDDPGFSLSISTQYSGLPTKTISYSYYPDGSRKSMTTPGGAFSYRYDALERLVSLTNPFGKTAGWQYRTDGLLTAQYLGNRAWTNYAYNPRGQLLRLTNHDPQGKILSDFSAIGYDGSGNVTGLKATFPGAPLFSGSTSYSYDSTGQLLHEQSARGGNYTRDYSYDAAGNPTHFGTLTGSVLQYNSNNQLLDASYSYDGNGNPTLYKGNHLTFNTANHLMQFVDANNKLLFKADYNGDGLRTWKETYDQNGQPIRKYFLYDGETLICELDAAGNVLTTNTWGVTGLLARNRSFGDTT